jgi:hypothetical protein
MKGHKTCLVYRFRTVTVVPCRLIFCITTQRYFMAEGRAYDAAKIQSAADAWAASLRPMAGDDSLCWGAVKVLAL